MNKKEKNYELWGISSILKLCLNSSNKTSCIISIYISAITITNSVFHTSFHFVKRIKPIKDVCDSCFSDKHYAKIVKVKVYWFYSIRTKNLEIRMKPINSYFFQWEKYNKMHKKKFWWITQYYFCPPDNFNQGKWRFRVGTESVFTIHRFIRASGRAPA